MLRAVGQGGEAAYQAVVGYVRGLAIRTTQRSQVGDVIARTARFLVFRLLRGQPNRGRQHAQRSHCKEQSRIFGFHSRLTFLLLVFGTSSWLQPCFPAGK